MKLRGKLRQKNRKADEQSRYARKRRDEMRHKYPMSLDTINALVKGDVTINTNATNVSMIDDALKSLSISGTKG